MYSLSKNLTIKRIKEAVIYLMAFFMKSKNQTVKEYIKGLIIKRIMSDTFKICRTLFCHTDLSDTIENIKIYDTTFIEVY